ncbi:YsnF/AvaK domain-containing protein [Sodalis sp. RH22]|uniref:YsnF/AvaK domain-containing protein n=1 Tax=unclassified Sodalis (in: enterobacteria) TaxID=2636512 RepID=UPI0039B532E6
MAHEKIVTAFKALQQAQVAKEKLIAEGIAEHNIDIISGERLRVKDKEIRHPSFWQRLFGDDVDDDYATEYTRAVQTGGVLLTVRVPKEDADRIETLLDQLADDYVSSGNTDTPAYNRGLPGDTGAVYGRTASAGVDTGAAVTIPPVATGGALETENRESLKLAEEQVEIGKHQVSDGTVRVRRYTIEDEVAEDISLYDQHADVVLRAVDEPVYLSDVDWSEKTIDIEESHEEPVVNKTARVREEAAIRSEVNERVETVRDTVRRQEVDVEKNDANRFASDKSPGLHK